MSTLTEFLKLLKKDPITDGHETFNIDTMLNDNWDKIDAAIKQAFAFQENSRKVIRSAQRDPTKPNYGISGSANAEPVLKLSNYSGTAEFSAVVNDSDYYDAENLSANAANAPEGTIIIKTMED